MDPRVGFGIPWVGQRLLLVLAGPWGTQISTNGGGRALWAQVAELSLMCPSSLGDGRKWGTPSER